MTNAFISFFLQCECKPRVCSVRERSGMECNGSVLLEWVGSILVFSWNKKVEWNGSVWCLVETNIWNGIAKFYGLNS
jgi:hypothetical protein